MLITVSAFLTLPRSSQPLHPSKSFLFIREKNRYLNKIKWNKEEIAQNKETTGKIESKQKDKKHAYSEIQTFVSLTEILYKQNQNHYILAK